MRIARINKLVCYQTVGNDFDSCSVKVRIDGQFVEEIINQDEIRVHDAWIIDKTYFFNNSMSFEINATGHTTSGQLSVRIGYINLFNGDSLTEMGTVNCTDLEDSLSHARYRCWHKMMDGATWSMRRGHSTIVFPNQTETLSREDITSLPSSSEASMLTIGGLGPYDGSGNLFSESVTHRRYNDVWRSFDGANWECISNNNQWEARDEHTCVVFNNKIWVIGGLNSNRSPLNDVWCSSDGVTWEIKPTPPWYSRYGHTSVVYDNKLWIMGGTNPQLDMPFLDDIWYTEDGESWRVVIPPSSRRATFLPFLRMSWSGRFEHTTVVFNDGTGDKLWVACGFGGQKSLDDVWKSSNGLLWRKTRILDALLPLRFRNKGKKRNSHTCVVKDEKLYLIGGIADNQSHQNDVLCYSPLGLSVPVIIVEQGLFRERIMHSSVVFKDLIWVIGGYKPKPLNSTENEDVPFSIQTAGNFYGDIWCSDNGSNWQEVEIQYF